MGPPIVVGVSRSFLLAPGGDTDLVFDSIQGEILKLVEEEAP